MEVQEFNLLFSTLSDKLYRMAKSMLQNTDEAKDAVQELQLKLWEKREVFNNVENKCTFTLKIMRNLCIDILRKKQNLAELPQEIEQSAPTPMQQLEMKDINRYVSTLIDKLPEVQRAVMRMRDVEEMEIAEIAYVTALSENAVCVNLSRARAKIRLLLLSELQSKN